MEIVNRKALRRISVGIALVVILLLSAWWSMIRMPGETHEGPLPPPGADEHLAEKRLRADVELLAGEIGDRNDIHYGNLAKARDYLDDRLARLGYHVERQEYRLGNKVYHNLEAELPGSDLREELVIVGAHYDTVPGTPGAGDNAIGASAVLVVAELLSTKPTRRTVRFVEFVNEEPTFFQTPRMGSHVYAKRCRERGEKVFAMLALDNFGYYSDAPGSQTLLPPFNLFKSSIGDHVTFVGNFRSREVVRAAITTFRRTTPFPSDGLAVPDIFPGVGWSDHWSFWEHGYRALLVTDTVFSRYPHTHRFSDTPNKLHYDKAARVVAGVARVVVEMALSSAIDKSSPNQ
jgi:hypothetical protein